MRIKKIVILAMMILALGVTAGFAGDKTYDGWHNLILINGQQYELQSTEYLKVYDGTFFTPQTYKRMLKLDVVQEGKDWVVSKEGKLILRINEGDKVEYMNATLDLVAYAEDDTPFIMLEPIIAMLMPDVEMKSEILFDYPSEMPDIRIIRLTVSPEYYNPGVLKKIDPTLWTETFDKMKKTQSFISKMKSSKPVVNAEEMVYTDKSCRVIFTKEGKRLLNISFTGKLTPNAKSIIKAVLADDINSKMVDMAMKKITSLNEIATNLKKYKEAFAQLQDNEYPTWVHLSDSDWLYCKYSYSGSIIEGKAYIDMIFADILADVSDLN